MSELDTDNICVCVLQTILLSLRSCRCSMVEETGTGLLPFTSLHNCNKCKIQFRITKQCSFASRLPSLSSIGNSCMRHMGDSCMKQIQPHFLRLSISNEFSLLPGALIKATSTAGKTETVFLCLEGGRAHSVSEQALSFCHGNNRLLTPCSLLMRGLRAVRSSAKATLTKITRECTDVLKLRFHVTISMCVLWDDNTPAHKAQVHSLHKSLLIEKALCDSSRKDEILFCLATTMLVLQNQKLSFPEVFLLQLTENLSLHCLPHLCWSVPWGHQCCSSAGDRQKASFHLIHI